MKFITGMQQREDRACSNSGGDTTNAKVGSKADDEFAAVDSADEFVDEIIGRPPESESKQFWIPQALETIEMRERGEVVQEVEFDHWNGTWV